MFVAYYMTVFSKEKVTVQMSFVCNLNRARFWTNQEICAKFRNATDYTICNNRFKIISLIDQFRFRHMISYIWIRYSGLLVFFHFCTKLTIWWLRAHSIVEILCISSQRKVATSIPKQFRFLYIVSIICVGQIFAPAQI